MTTITRHLDWISFTANSTRPDLEQILPGRWVRTGKGMHGYADLYQHEQTGAKAMTTPFDEKMGSSLQFSGDCLSEIRLNNFDSDTHFVQHLHSLGGHCSRIDLAINIHDGTLTPTWLAKALKGGKNASTKARSFTLVSGRDGQSDGSTLYCGNRSSDKFFRCYDKRAELAHITDGKAWVRLELEVKNLLAQATGKAIVEHGSEAVIVGSVSDFINIKHSDFQEAIHGESVLPNEGGKQLGNTEKWLIETVAKAFAKVVYVNPDFFGTWYKVVQLELDTLRNHDAKD